MTAPPLVRVPRLADESALSGARAHALDDVGGGPGVEPPTTVRLGFTADAFLALFDATAEPPLVVSASAGGEVYRDECVELFLSSPGESALYQEVVANPAAALYAARVTNPDDSRATWHLSRGEGLEGVTVVVEGAPAGPPSGFARWTCLLRIPWFSLPGGGPPSDGEERRGNATRIARGRTTRYLALSPTRRSSPPDFHVPSRFARFLFSS